MVLYWALLLLPLWGIFSPRRLRSEQAWIPWAGIGMLLATVIGLREQVGGDWGSYQTHFRNVAEMSLRGALTETKDPGYYLLNWLASRAGATVHAANLACAAIMMAGVIRFCREQPFPWLALFVAVPYLLIVVGMGYTRQSAAIGLVMLGLAALGNGHTRTFVVWTLIAASFHKSAVLLLPVAALAATERRLWNLVWIAVIAALGAWLFVLDSSEQLWSSYVRSDYAHAAEGGAIRVAMNAAPAVLLIVWNQRLLRAGQERKLWLWLAVASLVCVPLLSISATAVDRIALYLIPLQLLTFARLPTLARSREVRTAMVLAVVVYYATVQYVWLNFASHAGAWIPYRFVFMP